jgi:hypothetical protein
MSAKPGQDMNDAIIAETAIGNTDGLVIVYKCRKSRLMREEFDAFYVNAREVLERFGREASRENYGWVIEIGKVPALIRELGDVCVEIDVVEDIARIFQNRK